MAQGPRSANSVPAASFRSASSTVLRGVRTSGRDLAHARSSTVARFGSSLVNEADHADEAVIVSKQVEHMARPVVKKSARGVGAAAGRGGRLLRNATHRSASGGEAARRHRQDRAAKTSTKTPHESRPSKWGRAGEKIGGGSQAALLRGHRVMKDMDHMSVGQAEVEAANKTNQWTITAASRATGFAKSQTGRGLKRSYRFVRHPVRSARALRRRAGVVGHRARSTTRYAHRAAQVARRAVVRSVKAVVTAFKAMAAAVASSSVLMVVVALMTVVSLVMSIFSIFTMEDHRRKTAPVQTACVGGTGTLKVPSQAAPWVAEAAKTSTLPPGFIAAIMNIESSFNPRETSPAGPGYFGLLQIGYGEVADVGGPAGVNMFDPMQNAHWGGLILKMRLGEAQAAVKKHPVLAKAPITDLVAIGHNAGPGRIPDWTPDGRSLPVETQGYLVKLHRWFKPGSADASCSAAGGAIPASAQADRKGWYADLTAHAPGFVVGDHSLIPDARQFIAGECVSFVGWMLSTHGVPGVRGSFTNNWHGAHFGNANEWPAAARQVGVGVDTTPAVGAVAERDSGRNGHVAYITKVYPDKSFDIEQGNFPLHHQFGTGSHVRIGRQFDHVLHFEKGIHR